MPSLSLRRISVVRVNLSIAAMTHGSRWPGSASYYLNVLHPLRDAIRQKWLQLWATGDWQLHHDNTPAHASRPVQSFLAKHQIIQLTQPHYSPDLAPCDFWLFKKLRLPMKGKRFQTVDEVQENTMGLFVAIPTKDFAVF